MIQEFQMHSSSFKAALILVAMLAGGCASTPAPTAHAGFQPVPGDPGHVTLHMIGDSTMTMYKEERRPQMGWGEKMPAFLKDDVKVINWALGGRSSRSFYYEESRWPSIRPQIRTGDYVLIQFGHNDQKNGGNYERYGTYAFCSDGSTDGENCPDVEHSYYQFIKRYVIETRLKGANPILMSPISRKYFEGDHISIKGQHNLTKAGAGEMFPRGDYVAAMRAVAERYEVPFVDLTSATRDIVEEYGNAEATRSLYIAADNTHPQVLFATLIAQRAAEGMRKAGVLADQIVEPQILVSSPDMLNFGVRYKGNATVKQVVLTAFSLQPAKGEVTVRAPRGYALSLDEKTWADKLEIQYADGKFSQALAVRFLPEGAHDYAGTIAFVADKGAKLGVVGVKGQGVKPGSGVDVAVLWPMTGSAQATVDGPVSAENVSVVGLKATEPVVMAVDGQDATITRYSVTSAERNARQYLQYAVTASVGSLRVSEISAYLGSSGGNSVQADVEYSLNADFSQPVRLTAEGALSFGRDEIVAKRFATDLQVSAGQTVYVRIYPWNTAGNAGKALAVYNVKLSGRAMP
jgi:lysophospholipase L1-like esterase